MARRELQLAVGIGLSLAVWACDGDNDEGDASSPVGADGGPIGMDGALPGDGDGDAPGPDGAVAGDGDGDGNADGGGGPGPEADAGPVCTAGCDDGNACTADECVAADVCTHELEPDLCPEGQSCHPMNGCVTGATCSQPSDCADDDGCTTNERCEPALATCQFDPLDGDDDGAAPVVCGGADCNDDDEDIGPGEPERCNGEDDDCDGVVDDAAECPGEGFACVEGSCECPEPSQQCGGVCADVQTDRRFCGDCQTSCGPAGVCNAGACECPAPGTMCGNVCVDTSTSQQHCGGCNMPCNFQAGEACIGSQCTPCGGAGEACCPFGPFGGCANNLDCSGEPGTAGAVCTCASPNTMCGEDCVDLATADDHCGDCETACAQDESCLDVGAGPACTPCGEVGERCCERGGFRFCLGQGGGGPGGPGGGGGGGPGGGGPTCNPQTSMCED